LAAAERREGPGKRVGLFLKSDFIGFQIFPAIGREEALKGVV
jgi:hypothetical protein